MNYQKIIDDFITEYPDYKSDVMNFTEYLEIHWGNSLSGEPLRILLKGIDVEFILQSLIYNVEDIQRYKSKTKAKRYATVVGLFFNYIRKTTDIANPELYDAISFNRLRENSYMKRMMAYIEKCDLLAGIVEQEPLTFMQEELLAWSNEQLEDTQWGGATDLKKPMAAIGIKMMNMPQVEGIFIMKNKYILPEMNQRNEIRADVNMAMKSMELTEIENMNVKIDTGCPYTSIPILRFGISSAKAQQMKQRDCDDDRVRKEISFGVNDSKENRFFLG